ncbi:MAG: hypothetical protein JW860_09865 [Sedimentisphaerales bacterium]|nr:hypothetical protein [Sedimentisphaerales bacterium]
MNLNDIFSEKEIKRLNNIVKRRSFYKKIKLINLITGIFFIVLVFSFWGVLLFVIMLYNVKDIYIVLDTLCHPEETYPGYITIIKECSWIGLVFLSLAYIQLRDRFWSNDDLLLKCWILLKDESVDKNSIEGKEK